MEFGFSGQAYCDGVGGSNPVAALIAQTMMAEGQQLVAQQAQSVDSQALAAVAGLQRGGVGFGK